MSSACRCYDCKHRWGKILSVGFGAIFMMVETVVCIVAAHQFAAQQPYAVVICGLASIIFATIGVWLACCSIRMTVDRLRGRRRIELSDTSILAPRSPMSSELICVPYDTITQISCTEVFGTRTYIKVKHAGGRLRIAPADLPKEGDADELLHILSERASLPISSPIRWPRQFSLSSILIVITIAAVLLGFRMWLLPPPHWFELWMLVGFLAFFAVLLWLMARWRSIVPLVIGVLVGAAVNAVFLVPAISAWLAGWACSQTDSESWGGMTRLDVCLPIVQGSMLLSMLVFGVGTMIAWHYARRLLRRMRRDR